MTGSPDRVQQLADSLAQMRVVLERISTGQLEDPTPCASWDVRRLIGHVISSDIAMYTARARDEPFDTEPPLPDLADGWVEPFAVAADTLVEAWRSRGELEGDPVANEVAEFALHAWDLAVATRQDVSGFDPDLAEAALAWMTGVLKPEYRGSESDGKMFGPEVDVDEDASPYERLAAFSGRAVG